MRHPILAVANVAIAAKKECDFNLPGLNSLAGSVLGHGQTGGKPTRCEPTRSHQEHERGQALVEFALVLMFVILPFTFVLIDGAITLFTLANVTNAAREGARAGSIYQASAPAAAATIDAARQTYMFQEAQARLGPLVAFSQCTKQISYFPATAAVGNPYRELNTLSFRIECPRRLLFGLVGTGAITLTSESSMRIEPGGVAP